MSQQVKEREGIISHLLNYPLFAAVDDAINEFYNSAFKPEIIQALEFIQESKLSAELIAKYLNVKGENKTGTKIGESKFQINLMYIQKQFESALSQIRLRENHILFVDGIDIRPSSIAYSDYIECIKGLANSVWELNNDFFPSIKGGGGRMRVVLLIRPDIFESLGLQNQNTKIRDNSVYLDWRTDYINHRSSQLFEVTDHLLGSQQDPLPAPGQAWDSYFPWNSQNVYDTYPHPTSFINFLRWSYYRPRDIVVMLDLLKEHFGKTRESKILIEDFENPVFIRDYSNYLLGEVKDHLSFYYSAPDYEAFLKFFEFLSGENKFQYDDYLLAFQSFKEHIDSTGQTPQNSHPRLTSFFNFCSS